MKDTPAPTVTAKLANILQRMTINTDGDGDWEVQHGNADDLLRETILLLADQPALRHRRAILLRIIAEYDEVPKCYA